MTVPATAAFPQVEGRPWRPVFVLSYAARSLWPAVFFHSFHNTISQWLFPKLFTVAAGQIWLDGEGGVLPMLGYVLLGGAMYWGMRRRGQTWRAFADQSLRESRETVPASEFR